MRIRISNQGEPSRIESFDHKTEIRIGRVASNDLVLAERGISSNHARLHIDPSGQLIITDLGSTNGTFVNGRRVQGSQPITLYDEVYVCHIKIEVAIGNQSFPPEAPPDPVQTGRTQMASAEQVEMLRRSRASGTLSGEIGGSSSSSNGSAAEHGQWNQPGQVAGPDQGQWNQGGGQGGYDQGAWNQAGGAGQAGYDHGQWNQQAGGQAGYDHGQWNQQGYAQPGYEQAGYEQAGYEQAGYEQAGYEQAGYEQQGYDQGQWNQQPSGGGHDQGQWNQAGYGQQGYEQAGYDAEEIEEVEAVEEVEDVEELEPEPEPEPEPAVARRNGPPRPGGGLRPSEPSPSYDSAPQYDAGPSAVSGPPSLDDPSAMSGPPSFDAGPPAMSGPPSFDGPPAMSGPPSLDAGPPGMSGPPSLADGPAAMSGPPSFDGPPAMSGPPSFDGPPGMSGPPSFDGPPAMSGPPSLDAGPPAMSGPPSLDAGPPAMSGPPSFDGPPAMSGPPSLDAGPPAMSGPPSLDAGPPAMSGPPSIDGPPAMSGPPSFEGPPAMSGPPSLDAGPPAMSGPPSFEGHGAQPPSFDAAPASHEGQPPSFDAAPPSRDGQAPSHDAGSPRIDEPSTSTSASTPVRSGAFVRPLIEPQQEVDLRPEFAARARVFFELLAELGATLEQPPEDGEKQRKAARVGAKRRLAVIARNDPDLMLDELGAEADRLLAELFELGPLTSLVDDPAVREIIIRDPHHLYVDRGYERQRFEGGFSCAESLALALRRFIGTPVRWDASAPWLDHRMADGIHVRAADASVAPGGPVVVITRPGPTVTGLSQMPALAEPIAEYLRAVLRARGSVLVCVGQGCDGTVLASACAHELGNDGVHLAIVRAGSQLSAPHGAMVLDAEPGLSAAAIRLAIDTGSTALLLHRGGGAGLASAWAGLDRGLAQLVVTLSADTPEAALEACVDGLLLGGFGRDREALRRQVAASIQAIVVLGVNARGDEVPVALTEFDAQGRALPVISRPSADASWQHHRAPAFVAEMARRGVTFEPAKLASLART